LVKHALHNQGVSPSTPSCFTGRRGAAKIFSKKK